MSDGEEAEVMRQLQQGTVSLRETTATLQKNIDRLAYLRKEVELAKLRKP